MKKLVVMFAVIGMVSCSTKKSEAVSVEFNEMMQEVIEVHDIAMAEMGTIMSLKQELVASIDSTAIDSTSLQAIKDLDAAHEGMMVWMRDFSNAFSAEQLTNGLPDSYESEEEKAAAEEALRELKSQKMSVKVMNENIQKSLAQAKSILGKE